MEKLGTLFNAQKHKMLQVNIWLRPLDFIHICKWSKNQNRKHNFKYCNVM